jgi:serine/threonine-protein kinase RsbW
MTRTKRTDPRRADATAPRRWATTAAPSEGSRTRRRGKTYAATKPSVGRARRELTEWLATGGADDLLVADVAVAVSEACTNAVLHAYRDAPTDGHLPLFRVTARRAGEAVTVTVADTGSGMPAHSDEGGIGLGLAVIAALTDHVDLRSGADGHGTVISMLFTVAGSRTRAPGRPAP